MRKLILALATISLCCGCCMFDRRPSSYYEPVSPSVPVTLPTGP